MLVKFDARELESDLGEAATDVAVEVANGLTPITLDCWR